MKKYFKPTILCILVLAIVILIGYTNRRGSTVKAIYLAPKDGGQLTKDNTNKYGEVIRVSDFNEFKRLVSKNTAIWIDKDVVDLLDLSWVQGEAENKIPIVLIGYNNAIYSFRDKLRCFSIKGPLIDWSNRKLEPGFSIGMLKETTETSVSVFLRGYETSPDTKQILSLTNMLLKGEFPE